MAPINLQLPVGKRVSLFQLMMQDIGYERSQLQQFNWEKRLLQNNIIITRLVCRIEEFEYFFEFDCSKPRRWRLKYTGEVPSRSENRVVLNWMQVLPHFRQWAQQLHTEVKSVDVYKLLSSPTPIYVPPVSNATRMLTIPERTKIIGELDRLRARIQDFLQIGTGKTSYLRSMFNILKEALSRLGRSDWTHTFIGIALSIGLELEVSFLNDGPFWQMFRETLKRITEIMALSK